MMKMQTDSVLDTGARQVISRFWTVIACLMALLVIGMMGFSLIEGWTLLESLYMAVITVTTVGFREVRQLSPPGMVFTILLIVGGVGTWAYTVGSFSRLLVEGDIKKYFFNRRLKRMINQIEGHTILCGFGRIGRLVCQELAQAEKPFVVIEKDPSFREDFESAGYLYLIGDATHDDILVSAGIKTARCLISVLGSDESNVYTVLIARDLNRNLYLVGRGEDESSRRKIIRAGADKVISPYEVGARSLAQAVLQPNVLNFIELATSSTASGYELALEEIAIPAGSPFLGKTLKDARIRERFGLIVIASRTVDNKMEFNPSAEYQLKEGEILIFMGNKEGLANFRETLSA